MVTVFPVEIRNRHLASRSRELYPKLPVLGGRINEQEIEF